MNNTKSDTPTVDAAEQIARDEYEKQREAGYTSFDSSGYDFARTLERELSDAAENLKVLSEESERRRRSSQVNRKCRDALAGELDSARSERDQLRSQNAELEKQVREANKKGAYYRSLLYGCSAHGLWEGLSCIGCIEQERDSLKAQLAEAVKDKARLDWLDSRNIHMDIIPDDAAKVRIEDMSEDGFCATSEGVTIRQAIDAAINQKP